MPPSSTSRGDLAQTVYEAGGGRPYPSLVDVLELFFYPFALAGLLSFPALRRTRSERIRFAIDLTVAGLGAGAFIAYMVVGPGDRLPP